MYKPLLMYIGKRFIAMIIAIWIGLTITFAISRLLPFNAADYFVARVLSAGAGLRGDEIEALRNTLIQLYGLNRSVILQYIDFLKNYITGNMGPSFAFFPTSVSEIIAWALPWSLALLMTVSVMNWIIGNIIGTLSAITKRRRIANALENFALTITPIPYVILGLSFLIIYALILRLPLTMYGRPVPPQLSIDFIISLFQRMMLPAISLMIFGWIGDFLAMKNLAIRLKQEDFILYKVLQGAPQKKINTAVFRNALIPQYTSLLLGLSRVFLGSVTVEYLFNYPGIGLILQSAIANADYNLMLGIISLTVVAVGIATFILDLTYPLIDPRIRYPGAG
ncbi:MAG: ABC transporter permease [Ignisphaera sp.]|uniref:ABC transporter permease n=1 Tax=Ignisphaera aggregans TaxID=334771 RepID=A0A7C4JJW6_9CREN